MGVQWKTVRAGLPTRAPKGDGRYQAEQPLPTIISQPFGPQQLSPPPEQQTGSGFTVACSSELPPRPTTTRADRLKIQRFMVPPGE